MRKGTCVRCGKERELSFEHVPPRAAGNNKPARLYSLLEGMNTGTIPWDFSTRKYVAQQRGTGVYYLCIACNNLSGKETVPPYLEMFKQIEEQNVIPLESTLSISWDIHLKAINPRLIAQQIVLMIACMNDHGYVKKYEKIKQILMDTSYRPRSIPHGLYMFINSGALSVSYPVTTFAGNHDVTVMTGVYAAPMSFHMEAGSHRNPYKYFDISNWLTDSSADDTVDLEVRVPILPTNVGLPGVHTSRNKILENLGR